MSAKKNFYTYAEAKAAVQALKIESQPEYTKRYREDQRLPSSPRRVYADTGWADWYCFLGNTKFSKYTYAEAQAAAQTLGVKCATDYKRRHSEDPRLPGCPRRYYAAAGWTGWYGFLGKAMSPWYTYAEAQAAAQALGIKNPHDYKKRYREDVRLPSKPYRIYVHTGWAGWHDFLGTEKSPWHTYAEAQAVVQALGIKSLHDYKKRHSEDPRLPATPNGVYAASGWKSWYAFLGNEKLSDVIVAYPVMWADVEQWLETQRVMVISGVWKQAEGVAYPVG